MSTEKKHWLPLNENTRFLLLTASIFCLMLGGAVLLFVLIEQLFFEPSFGRPLAFLAFLALSLGGFLLRYGRFRLR